MNSKPLLSIIIPIYNSFHLINNCLDCLEKQTSKNFEVIFVDDCSTDGGYKKLKSALKKYGFNYKVLINDKNMGPGFTRNNGISYSKADYITFIDSDDYVENDFVEKLETLILTQNVDAIFFDYYDVNGNEIKKHKTMQIGEGIINNSYALALCNGMCWGKVYRRKIIVDNNIKFPNLIRSEDLAFVKVFVSKCKKIYYYDNPLYYYVSNSSSIMHSINTMNINNNITAFNYIKENVKKSSALEMVFIKEYLYLIVQIMILQKCSAKDIKHFIVESNKIFPNWFENEYIKNQPFYLKVLLKFIKYKLVLPLRMVFVLKKLGG